MKPLVAPAKTYAVDARGVVRVSGSRVAGRSPALAARNVNGVPTVFAGLQAVLGARCRAAWYRVLLPLKPNGTTGYVRARA